MMQVSQKRAGRRYSSDSLPRGCVDGAMVGSGTESSGTSSCLATSARASAKRPFGGEPADRFRAPAPDQQADHRRRHAEHRHPAPADRLDQCRRRRRGKKPAGRGENQIKTRQKSPMAGRCQLDLYGQRRGDPRGQPDADEEAQDREHLPRAAWHHAHQPGGGGADEGAGDHRDLAANEIRQPAKDESAENRADTAAVEDHRRLAVGQVPLRRQLRQQVSNHEKIEEFDDKQRRQQDERDPVSAVQRRRVEQCQQVVGSLSAHLSLPSVPPPAPASFVLQR